MNLNHKTFGEGEPLIILHGLFGMLDNWQTLARQFAEYYTVILVDQRNHGRSPWEDAINYPLMAEDLRLFMQEQFISKAHLLGHSMGGKTVMEFAQQNPDMVDKLIVVDIAPKRYQAGHNEIFNALLSMDLSKVENRKDAEDQLARYIEHPAIRQFLLKNLSREKTGGYRWKMNLPVIHAHYDEILQPISEMDGFDGPTLFIRGAKSNYIQDDDLLLIFRHFPNAQLKTIPNAAHWVHAEQPQALLEMVLDFLG